MHRKTFRRVVVMLAFGLATGLALPTNASAQVTTTGTITTVIEDAQGGRLPGVTVTASANDVVTTRTVVSDAEGVATLEALAPSAAYVIKASLSGFRDYSREAVLVSSGKTTTLHVQLTLQSVTEQVLVTGSTPVVDVTRAVSGQDITLQLTESLPTGRSYQSYLQLVPGVMPDSTNQSGNPSSRSGMNWKDVITGDNLGVSTDNSYYFEGINVTDPVNGTFGANLNTEIIQEQKVLTGGIPAEFVGAPGLISTVVTKSGSNTAHGSYNYFFQNNNLVAENDHTPGTTFSSHDTAFTIGGPAVRDKVWGFGSWRYTKKTEDIAAQDTHLLLRTPSTIQKQGFAKATWTPTSNDLVSFMFLNDPFTRTGSIDPSVANSRDRERHQGGNNYSGVYNRVWSGFLVDAAANWHDAEITDLSIDRTHPRNTVSFQRTDVRTLADEQLGGYGNDLPETRPTVQARGSVQYQLNRQRLKAGLEWAQHEDHRNNIYIPDSDPALYTSISSKYLNPGVTAASIATGPWSARTFVVTNASDYNGFINKINTLPNRAQFYTLYDTDRNGTITQAELGQSLVFNSNTANPNGQVNYYRSLQTALGPQDTKVRGLSFFGQDEFALNRWTFNVGLRAEQWSHFATTGESVFDFEWTWAPRLSAVYDVKGDGLHKASAYWGRYYDPIRMDMTNFAGTLNGQIREEQVFANNQWVTYRTRGGPAVQDGYFSPTTKTPYTDEFQGQYEVDFGNNMSGSAIYYHRQTRDIFEDFDPGLYTEPSVYGGNINDPNTLFLGWDYFGWTASNHPAANFFLGTLPGGERNYNGLEFVFRKRYADQWQFLSSYNYLNAQGNTVSDGNADFGGDVLWLDPRAPNMEGVVPGTINHIFKSAGSYTTKYGLELGGTYRWNSGTIVNKTQLQSSRRLPIEVDTAFVSNGVSDFWVAPGAIGAVSNPGWGSVDLRAQYIRPVGKLTTEFFVDLFNLFNDQATVRTEDLVAGTGTTAFGDDITWVQPFRAFFGARVRF
jgi:hypothetical protein